MTDKNTYIQLCKEPNSLPLFLQCWWLDVVCAAWDAAVVYNGDKVAGVWPYSIEKKAGVTIVRTPALTPYMGPHIFFPHDLKESKRDNFEHEVTLSLLEKMPDAKVWAVTLQPGQKQVGLYRQQDFDIQTRQTFLMPLDAEEADIFLKLNEDYRRNIRKAEAAIAITHEPEQLPLLRQYLEATLDRKDVKMYYSAMLMQQLFNACNEQGASKLWVARKDGEVQAILWHVWDVECAYYLAGSRNPAVKDTKAMTALIWHAIKESKKMGKKLFDFEGSMDPGVEKFFRNFGATRELYLVLNKNNSTLWKLKTALH